MLHYENSSKLCTTLHASKYRTKAASLIEVLGKDTNWISRPLHNTLNVMFAVHLVHSVFPYTQIRGEGRRLSCLPRSYLQHVPASLARVQSLYTLLQIYRSAPIWVLEQLIIRVVRNSICPCTVEPRGMSAT